jgi:DNA modification methylase
MSKAFTLHQGDCMEVMRGMTDASVDAIVTDPPYHLTTDKKGGCGQASVSLATPHGRARIGTGFMGMKWDGGDVAFRAETWAEALRVLKPGGHLLAFSGSRTYHRMVVAIEDAGFEIRDQIMWLYGSGFPKSRNLDGEWEGWGTALKPAHEPICVARKALAGTVAFNMGLHSTGALNIDGCRISSEGEANPSISRRQGSINHLSTRPAAESEAEGKLESRQSPETYRAERAGEQLGRWPANVIHDGSDEVLAMFPDAPGQMADASTDSGSRRTQNVYGAMHRGRGEEASADSENDGAVGFKMKPGARRLDEGSAARFFYCAKTSSEDRHEGLPMPGPQFAKGSTLRDAEKLLPTRKGNFHPTVKPTDLMRYLCRLVTPPAGLVLDPFMGSGSTGKAAVLEGFAFVGIDLDPAHVAIAQARIEFAARMGHQPSLLEAA